MPTRQTRIFVESQEPIANWCETLLGRLIAPVTAEYSEELEWFWFSRYASDLNGDNGDCEFETISDACKNPLTEGQNGFHRSLRFRYSVSAQGVNQFEQRIQVLLPQFGYHISDFRDYNAVADTGGQRFLGNENRLESRNEARSRLVLDLYGSVSALVLDCLVGPDKDNRFKVETNDNEQNPNGSTFESLHHLFCNISEVPTSILFAEAANPFFMGTYWGQGQHRSRSTTLGGMPVKEVYVKY